jgi:hypothetical protein
MFALWGPAPLGSGLSDGARERTGAARLVDPEIAGTAHVSEVDEYEAAFSHVAPRADWHREYWKIGAGATPPARLSQRPGATSWVLTSLMSQRSAKTISCDGHTARKHAMERHEFSHQRGWAEGLGGRLPKTLLTTMNEELFSVAIVSLSSW